MRKKREGKEHIWHLYFWRLELLKNSNWESTGTEGDGVPLDFVKYIYTC